MRFIHDVDRWSRAPPRDELRIPTMYFLIADELLIFDRVAQTITRAGQCRVGRGPDTGASLRRRRAEIERLVSLLEQPTEHIPVTVPSEVPAIPFESNVPKERFFANVRKRRNTSSARHHPVGRFAALSTPSRPLRSTSIAPRARSILRPICSCSNWQASPWSAHPPEIHVRCENQKVEIRPIAGTRPRQNAGARPGQ